jgi:hypothetical protein
MRALGAMRVLAYGSLAVLLAGCVLNPYAEFRRQYETDAIGKNFLERTKGGYAPFRPPEVTAAGTVIYSLYGNYDRRGGGMCVLFYETRNDVIIHAWHEGKLCAIAN